MGSTIDLGAGLTPRLERLLRQVVTLGRVWIIALIVAGLAAAWLLSYGYGGAHVVPPHGFYFPIVLAGVRFGLAGATVTAVSASVLAGPLLPAHVGRGVPQPASDWIIRSGFFVALGACIAVLVYAVVQHERNLVALHDAERELAKGLDTGQLSLMYQPIVTIDGRPVGVEALARWDHPERGTIPPDRFIPLAERSGLIVPLGRWALETACAQLAEWRRDLLAPDEPFRMAVNVSPRQLEQSDFPRAVAEVIAATGVAGHELTLEITETALVEDLERSIAQLDAVKQTGVEVAIDDFGVGYGSLTYVHRFPVDELKVDRSFTAALPESGSVVGGIILLARSLGVEVVVEGVETAEQASELRSLGATLAQGWLYSQAIPPDIFAARVRAGRDRLHALPSPQQPSRPGRPPPGSEGTADDGERSTERRLPGGR